MVYRLEVRGYYWQNTLVYRSAIFCGPARAEVPGISASRSLPAGRTTQSSNHYQDSKADVLAGAASEKLLTIIYLSAMNLIIQGLEVANYDLRELAKLAGADQIERITGEAFRLKNAKQREHIAEYCAEAELDFAFVEETTRLADFGLVAMDMDSTLLAIESIDEIADMQGIKPQVAEITQRTMRGEIVFAESLRQRTALLAGLDQSALHEVYDNRVRLSPGAEKMLQQMKSAGLKTMVISGGFTFFTDRIKTDFHFDYTAANRLEIVDGKLTGKVLGEIIGAGGKAVALEQARNELGLKREQVIAIGDGANDLKMMEAAGVSVAYHAKPIVQEKATYALNHVGLDGVLNLFA
jgi:phosphoserine phosphatase